MNKFFQITCIQVLYYIFKFHIIYIFLPGIPYGIRNMKHTCNMNMKYTCNMKHAIWNMPHILRSQVTDIFSTYIHYRAYVWKYMYIYISYRSRIKKIKSHITYSFLPGIMARARKILHFACIFLLQSIQFSSSLYTWIWISKLLQFFVLLVHLRIY